MRSGVALFALCLVVAAVPTAGCRSTSTNVTGPSSSKCAVSLSGTGLTLPGAGGSGSIGISVNRECSWTATSQSDWITISGATSGQGPATVAFRVPANPAATIRRGAIAVGQQRVEIQQDAAECEFTIAPASASVPGTSATVSVAVTTLGGCTWTSQSSVPWARISGGSSGSGPGSVTIDVDANTGPSRGATLTLAGRPFALTQAAAAACTVTASASPSSFAAGGGAGVLSVVAAPGCGWSASATEAWVSFGGGASGSGNGVVPFQVSQNSGGARSASLVVGGQSVAISQAAAGCTFNITPPGRDVPAAGGTEEFEVATASTCSWTAVSNVPWITITRGVSGTGNGRVGFAAAANTSSARTGTITIGGVTVAISQPAGACSYSVAPVTVDQTASGGSGSVTVTTGAGCTWTAVSSAPWITVTAASGSGPGNVSFSVASNPGSARQGTLTVAGQVVTVRQDGTACTFTVSAPPNPVPSSGGTFTLDVTGPPACGWSASSGSSWLQISSATSGGGTGRVTVNALANTDVQPRTGTLAIAGQTISVTQAGAACSYTLAPLAQTVAVTGGNGLITVTTASGCAWTATSSVPWISITSGAAGAGNGTVSFAVPANTSGSPRSGTLTVGGQTATVNQQ
jgi:hypothetical protein